jgi:RNA polymerase sigma factor (sigma-70 family)
MKTQWTFHQCDRAKERARSYWSKKTQRLERLLANYAPDVKRVHLTLYHHSERAQWELRAVLHLPTGTLTVEDTSPTLNEAIDAVTAKLATSIGQHKSELRKRHLNRGRKHRRRQFASASQFLAQDAAANRTDAFAALISPYADQLYDHARRELRVLEKQGEIPKGELAPSDLVDDLLLRACERFQDRFPDTSIDVWLFEQLHQQLEELRLSEPPVSLAVAETEVIADEVDDDDLGEVHYWMERLLEPPQPLSLEEMVPDERWNDIWDTLDANEKRERLAKILQGLPKHQRQALMLKDVYGFETFELVKALGRCSEDIESDLSEAREKVRVGLGAVESTI